MQKFVSLAGRRVSFTVTLCLALAGFSGAVPAGDNGPLNVVFIAIDDLRDVAAFDPIVKTPNLDRLATWGMKFDRAYVQVTFCNPSRTSLLTGLRPHRTGVLDNRLHFRTNLPDVVTLPEQFRKTGYYSLRLGKIYHGAADMDDPKSWDKAVYPTTTPLGHRGEKWQAPGGEPNWCRSVAAEGGDEDQPDGQIAKLAVEFLQAEHDRPFFLAVGFHKPHDPFVAPKSYFDLYPLETAKLHVEPEGRSATPTEQIGGRWKIIFDRFSDRDRRQFLRAYYAAATFMDAQLGKVLDALEETGLRDRTVVVLLSDHGYHLGERGWWNKSTLYEYSARASLTISTPRMPTAGQRCTVPVEFLDIYPTLMELCDLTSTQALDGRSLVPLLNNPGAPWQSAAFTVLRRGDRWGRSVRTPRWRYVEWGEGEDAELFDQDTDPGEWHNVVDRSELQPIVRQMQGLIRKQLKGNGN